MKNILRIASLTALMASAPYANAGEFFIGLNAGTSDFVALEDECDEFLADERSFGGFPLGCNITSDSDTTLSINAGYNFNRYFGLEAGYVDLGEYTADALFVGTSTEVTADADIAYLGLVLTAPFTDAFSLSARLGGVNASATIELPVAGVSADFEDETTGFVGVSADYRLTDRVSLQLRYDDLDVINMTSVGVRLHF